MARLLIRPQIQRFIDQTFAALTDENLDLQIAEIPIERGSKLEGITLADANTRFQLGATVLSLRHKTDLRFHPGQTQVLAADDLLVALGTSEELAGLETLATHDRTGFIAES